MSDEADRLVAGTYMDRSVADFQRSCCAHIEEEQRKPNQDTALIALLCDAVRCSRELIAATSTTPAGFTWEDALNNEPPKSEVITQPTDRSGLVREK